MTDTQTDETDMITIGTLSGAFGVRGEVRIKSFCADPAAIADYGPFEVTGLGAVQTLVLTGQAKGGFTARLDGIATKEHADSHKGAEIRVPRSRLPALPDDEYYYTDLIGLEVVDTGGALLGQIKAVQDHGAGDLLEIHRPGATVTALIPFTRAIVPTVDLAAGRVVVDPPEGML